MEEKEASEIAYFFQNAAYQRLRKTFEVKTPKSGYHIWQLGLMWEVLVYEEVLCSKDVSYLR